VDYLKTFIQPQRVAYADYRDKKEGCKQIKHENS
jgi:hypothetical protein